MTEITKAVSRSIDLRSGNIAVGLVARPLTLEFRADQGICISADPTNTAPIYIGGPGVTATQDDDSGGFVLRPGMNLVIPCDNGAKIYAISSDTDQKLSWILV